jgi:hypothetical protein
LSRGAIQSHHKEEKPHHIICSYSKIYASAFASLAKASIDMSIKSNSSNISSLGWTFASSDPTNIINAYISHST